MYVCVLIFRVSAAFWVCLRIYRTYVSCVFSYAAPFRIASWIRLDHVHISDYHVQSQSLSNRKLYSYRMNGSNIVNQTNNNDPQSFLLDSMYTRYLRVHTLIQMCTFHFSQPMIDSVASDHVDSAQFFRCTLCPSFGERCEQITNPNECSSEKK